MFIGKIIKIFEHKLTTFEIYKEAMTRAKLQPMCFDENTLMINVHVKGVKISSSGEIEENEMQMYFCCYTLGNSKSYKSDKFILTWSDVVNFKTKTIIKLLTEDSYIGIKKKFDSFNILDHVPTMTVEEYRNIIGNIEHPQYTLQEYTDLLNDSSTILRAVSLHTQDYKDSFESFLDLTRIGTKPTIMFLPIDVHTNIISLKTKDNQMHIFLKSNEADI